MCVHFTHRCVLFHRQIVTEIDTKYAVNTHDSNNEEQEWKKNYAGWRFDLQLDNVQQRPKKKHLMSYHHLNRRNKIAAAVAAKKEETVVVAHLSCVREMCVCAINFTLPKRLSIDLKMLRLCQKTNHLNKSLKFIGEFINKIKKKSKRIRCRKKICVRDICRHCMQLSLL